MKWLRPVPGKLLNLGLRLVIGGYFLWAGAEKILEPGAFAEIVANYRMLPHAVVNSFAITLPWVEVGAGLFLIMGIWVRAGAAVIAALLMVFLVAISQAIARGLNIDCGCFGSVLSRKVGLRVLVEDLIWLALAAWLCWRLRESKTGGSGSSQTVVVNQPQTENA